MIFKLHYWFLAAGANAFGLLLGVYIQEYTDANAIEIGALYMLMPFTGLIFRPIICSKADREQNHQKCLIVCLFIVATSYAPFVVIPLLGPGVYREYPRICWYILITLKIVGDIAFGGVVSIGDALAINYARRLGTQFSVYRVWGTISWMVFGLIIGQVNEVPFLPKYVPGFMILIASSLMDMAVVWLWPKEYFKMISEGEGEENGEPKQIEGEEKKKSENVFVRSLMPKEVVWAHMKRKIVCLLTCTRFDGKAFEMTPKRPTMSEKEFKRLTIRREIDNFDNISIHSMASLRSMQKSNLAKMLKNPGSNLEIAVGPKLHQIAAQKEKEKASNGKEKDDTTTSINKMTQLRILLLLIRRDPRIVLYLFYFVGAGFTASPIGFLFMSLSERCHAESTCDFSLLGGLLQVSMALYETVIFLIIRKLQEKIGRLNTGALAFFLYSIKMVFYATIWTEVDPYWSLLFEGLRGAAWGIYLTLMVELGYKFANEVQYIIPELIERRIIDDDSDSEHLKLALSSTMQSLVASAMDGVGRGFASLIFGLILHYNSDYIFLWRMIATTSVIMFLITVLINLVDYVFGFELGLDIAAEKKKRACERNEKESPVEA